MSLGGNNMEGIDYTYLNNIINKSYVFANDIDQVMLSIQKDKNFFEDMTLFEYLENETKQNEEFEYLDSYAKNNIYKMLSYYRNYYSEKENFENICERINKMIVSLNRSREINVYNFYYDEIMSRSLYPNKLKKDLEKDRAHLVYSEIRQMIIYDAYLMLRLFSKGETFANDFIEILKDENTIYSINKFLNEIPSILTNEVVNERIKAILDFSLVNSKSDRYEFRANVKVMRNYIDAKKDN
jgi:hypothetical protein